MERAITICPNNSGSLFGSLIFMDSPQIKNKQADRPLVLSVGLEVLLRSIPRTKSVYTVEAFV